MSASKKWFWPFFFISTSKKPVVNPLYEEENRAKSHLENSCISNNQRTFLVGQVRKWSPKHSNALKINSTPSPARPSNGQGQSRKKNTKNDRFQKINLTINLLHTYIIDGTRAWGLLLWFEPLDQPNSRHTWIDWFHGKIVRTFAYFTISQCQTT